MNIEKISKKKVSAIVVEQIEDMITSGKLQPGEKLPSNRELCELFDVGRSAVRDAINTLAGKGAVYVKQGEGTFICEFDSTKVFKQTALIASSKNIRELFQVRKILETGIAETAAQHRSPEDIKEIETLMDSPLDGWEADFKFHLTIAKATKNQIIIQLLEFISATTKQAMKDFHDYIQQDPENLRIILDQHLTILEAIKTGDSKQAKEAMKEHLNYVEGCYMIFFPKKRQHDM
ncbi:FadR/GntR family transcriptional regulator [Thalassobacillus sp. C254]|uniref:FadR/GntR family transcriptional regulator n=1 Tax=Thalassobacillus sp. C254 TaxID=1225341 RepID=UPI0006D00868|nr:FadR/GntR family transcriptional regulator [Thalassobacillus sp. C254]